MEFLTSREVSEKSGMSIVVVSRWAKNHNLERFETAKNGILTYKWKEIDYEAFLNRRTRKLKTK